MEPQRSLVLPIAMTVLISAIIFGGLGYYIATNRSPSMENTTVITPQSTASPASSISPTASAAEKTFTSSKYSFSIEHPKDWIVEEKDTKVTLMNPTTKAEIDDTVKRGIICEGCGPDLEIAYFSSVKNIPIIDGTYTKQKSLIDYMKNEKDTVSDYKTAAIGSSTGYWANESNIGGYDFYYVEDTQGHIYKLTFNSVDQSVIDTFLASFKFTK